MNRVSLATALALGAVPLLGACTTLGGHVSGQFSCRAPEGDCAPASVIDARATGANLAEAASPTVAPRGGRQATPGDLARTAERMLKIVFPAHVDAAGVFRDEAVAWAIAEPADWAARLRRQPGEVAPRALGRAIAQQLKRADRGTEPAPVLPDAVLPAAPPIEAMSSADNDPFSLVSPGSSPPTLREAVAGATAPEIEGFDAAAPGARTPRSAAEPAPLVFPSLEALDAAHARAGANAADDAAAPADAVPAKEPQ